LAAGAARGSSGGDEGVVLRGGEGGSGGRARSWFLDLGLKAAAGAAAVASNEQDMPLEMMKTFGRSVRGILTGL